MKKSLLFFCFISISVSAFSQNFFDDQSPFSWTLMAGGTLAYYSVKSTARIHSSIDGSGSAGASINYKFNDYFSISPALLIAGKGGYVTDQYDTYDQGIITQYDFMYIEESIRFTGHIPLGYRANIFFGAGPYYGNPVWGRTNYDSGNGQRIKFGKGGDFKSNDFGITSLIGFETESGYLFGMNFDLGLPNIRQNNSDNLDNEQFKNRSIYLSVGKSF